MILKYNLIVIALLLSSSLCAQKKKSNLAYVDPTIGGVGVILEPTRPTVHLPNSMLRVYPFKKDQLDDQISLFPLNVASHRIAWVFSFLPVNGADVNELWTAKFTIENEQTAPYYYKAEEEISQNEVEFTPSAKSGFFQVKFNQQSNKFLRLALFGSDGALNITGKRTITGEENFAGMTAYLYAETDTDIDSVKYQDGR